MHNLMEIPEGQRVQDILPQFAGVETETAPIGPPCPICPSCRKDFSAARKPRLLIRLYPIRCIWPIVFIYRLCGPCAKQYRAGGAAKTAVLTSVEAFIEGVEANT